MKWLIASDIHGSARHCGSLMERIQAEAPDRILLLGDLLYHGPRNALPEDYETMKVCEMLNRHRDKIIAVRGNCDAEVDQMVLEFLIMQDSAVIEEEGCLLFATHGHLYDEHRLPPVEQLDVLLNGHTHVPALHDYGHFVYMNPGSVSIPKGGSRHSYMTLEKGLYLWKDLKGEEYRRFEMTPRHLT